MSKHAAELPKPIRLYCLGRKPGVEVLEVPAGQPAPFAPQRVLTAPELECLVEELLQQLPESQRQAFYVKIRTDEMI